MNLVTSFLVGACLLASTGIAYFGNPYFALPLFVLGILIALSLKMANVWEKYVILRLGKLQSVKGAGLFAIIPIIDNVVSIIDVRIQTTAFNAEEALTRDTVPVNVDAIIFWHVDDAEKAALAITHYREAIDRPVGLVKFPHLWPGQNPPGRTERIVVHVPAVGLVSPA